MCIDLPKGVVQRRADRDPSIITDPSHASADSPSCWIQSVVGRHQGRLNHGASEGLGPRFSRYSVNPAASQLLLHDWKKELAVRVVYIRRHAPSLPRSLPTRDSITPAPASLRPFPVFACAHGGRLTSMGRHASRFSVGRSYPSYRSRGRPLFVLIYRPVRATFSPIPNALS